VKDFRIKTIYHPLNKNSRLEDLLLNNNEVPTTLPRLQALCQAARTNLPHLSKKDIFVMDSSPAVILGAMTGVGREVIVNVGNGHTLAAVTENGNVEIIYETHTGGLVPENFTRDLNKIIKGELSHEEILTKGGHGAYINSKFQNSNRQLEQYYPINLIGPNRNILKSNFSIYSHPGGNMMMAGPMGMIKAWKYRYS